MYIAGLILTTLLVLAYCWLILQYRKWFRRTRLFEPKQVIAQVVFFCDCAGQE